MSDLDRIVRCAIHPAIGVARVGNSRDRFYYAPEVPGQATAPGPSGYKTRSGEIKREAARFRVYGYDAEGQVVQEITADDGDVSWRVHVANRKAGWYKFFNALDLKQYALTSTYRNETITGALRDELVVDPGSKSINGRKRKGRRYLLNDGYIRFGEDDSPHNVPLGELRTDQDGRLVVLGGLGRSKSYDGSPAVTFANNDGWYDDVSDGPVRATVELGGRTLEAEPAMVVVTPPNYGQGLFGAVTMWDVVYDLFLRQGWTQPPEKLVFFEHIYPIFERLVGNQWVNQGIYFLFGQGSPSDLTDPRLLATLSSPDPAHRAQRQALFRWFRQPVPPWDDPGERTQLPPAQPAAIPPFYGDGFGEYAAIDDNPPLAIADLAITVTMHDWLKRWAEGDFETGEPLPPPPPLADLPVCEQPSALDRAPLVDCLGGPFHPGIELTWPMRVPSMWQKPDGKTPPFRLNILPEDETPQDDFGTELTPEIALGPDGPLQASGPGTLSRWLGVPWQTDEASCLSGYDASNYLPLPSFWAARVPNEVLSWGSYQRAVDPELNSAQRVKHFDYRQFWLRDLQGSSNQDRLNNMVAEWDKIGIVTEHPGAIDAVQNALPEKYWVETGRSDAFSAGDPTWLQVLRAERPPATEETDATAAHRRIAEDTESSEMEPAVHPRRRRLIRRDQR